MSKRVVIISGSPRKGGNSETLCDEFLKGCQEAGHDAVKVCLREKEINFCKACYVCRKTGECFQKDDVPEILEEMIRADVIVLATPVYFYSMAGQVKTLIDRCLSCGAKLTDKEFYFIATAADQKAAMAQVHGSLEIFRAILPWPRPMLWVRIFDLNIKKE